VASAAAAALIIDVDERIRVRPQGKRRRCAAEAWLEGRSMSSTPARADRVASRQRFRPLHCSDVTGCRERLPPWLAMVRQRPEEQPPRAS